MNYKVIEYSKKYRNDVSNIVVRNLLEVNSKDYGIEKMREHTLMFSPEKIDEYSKHGKIFVALDGPKVVGTLRAANDMYGTEGDYVLLTIFVLPEYHGKGIGRQLMEEGEKYIRSKHGKKITIPASVAAHKFYHKLGYQYVNDAVPNSDDVILMNKQMEY